VPSLRTPDGRTLAWETAGSGPLLVCHPGGPGGSGAYFDGAPELAAERTVLLLDPRGTGNSSRPADRHAYDLEDYAADIETLREHLGLEQIDLLGHSHGGFVAMRWAAMYPGSVGKLVLSNTAPRFTDTIREARRAMVAAHAGEPGFDDAIAALEAHTSGRYETDEELMALLAVEAPVLFSRGNTEDDERTWRVMSAAGINADVLKHFNEHVADGMDLRVGLENVTAPVLVITGGEDPMGESTAAEIVAVLPNASLVVVPHAGHFTFLEGAARGPWAEAILDFLRSG
jgi:pimeloyl-ACP methyl ester carboxylesterase